MFNFRTRQHTSTGGAARSSGQVLGKEHEGTTPPRSGRCRQTTMSIFMLVWSVRTPPRHLSETFASSSPRSTALEESAVVLTTEAKDGRGEPAAMACSDDEDFRRDKSEGTASRHPVAPTPAFFGRARAMAAAAPAPLVRSRDRLAVLPIRAFSTR
eukprot:NODE_4178_length_702_cov_145.438949.p1 GENE.NODE_4178_length_702_cov_145.438949~~NODE_4178_length_702_cov_145.438949.p1  ORF type:complete len:181 (-),score=67.02 NODE_4178_length_702_cov_145.438949:140-607(-)